MNPKPQSPNSPDSVATLPHAGRNGGESSAYEQTLLGQIDRRWLARIPAWLVIVAFAGILVIPAAQSVRSIGKTDKSAHRAAGERRRTALGRWLPDAEALRKVAAAPSVAAAGPGNNPYGDGHWFPTPPLVLMALVPLSMLGFAPAAVVWSGLKIVGVAVALGLLVRSHGPRGAPIGVLLMALAFGARALVSDLQHANVNIFMFVWIALCWACFTRGRDGWAGFFLALAIVTKVTPALAGVYFAYKRQWRLCIVAGLCLVLFVAVIPGVYVGFDKNVTLLADWFDMLVKPFAVQGWAELDTPNQSLYGTLLRVLSNYDALKIEEMPIAAALDSGQENMARPMTTAGRLIRPAVSLSVLALLAWVCRGRLSDRRGLRAALEFAMVLLAMLLLSERTWKHHATTLVMIYLAIWLGMTHLYWSRRARGAWVAALVAQWVMLVASGEGLLGDALADHLLDWGIFCWGLVLAFGQIGLMLLWMPRDPVGGRAETARGTAVAT